MRFSVLSSLSALFFGAQLMAQGFQPAGADGYFFPPPKGLYFFRPDLYVYQIPRYRSSWHFPRTTYRPYYLPPSRLYYPVSEGFLGQSALRYRGGPAIYHVVLSPPPTGGFFRVNTGDLVFDVTPPQALVYVDGRLIGSARDFARERDRFSLLDGEHDLRIEYPGYVPFEAQLQIAADRTIHLELSLEKVPAQPDRKR
jgi:hypothetical protein